MAGPTSTMQPTPTLSPTASLVTLAPTAEGLMDSDFHVTGCHFTRVTRVINAFNDVSSTIHL